jgi:hypothetical protein
MKREIQFQTVANAPNPIESNRRASGPTFKDDTYVPSHKGIQVKFQAPITWLRVIPAITGSQHQWMMKFKRFHDDEGRFPTFVDPSTFGLPSVFERALQWFRKNDPTALYRKENPRGFRFYPQDRGLLWVVDVNGEDGKRLRLLNASLYDGERGGSQGLGYQVWAKAHEVDSEPNSPTQGQPVHGDITKPEEGRLVGIEKSQTGEAKFTSYSVRIGKSASPLDMSSLTDAEYELLVPLEQTLHVPSEEEQKAHLLAYIGKDRFDLIFP